MTWTFARRWHVLTAVVVSAALLLQLALVLQGGRVLDEATPPGLGVRLGRLVSYFTIQSNVLVALAALSLSRDPARDSRGWRALRLAGVIGITVTGLVHWFLLRPLLDLSGWDNVADKLLHVVVPLLAVVGWLAFGPRPRIGWFAIGWALGWPIAWLGETFLVGALTGWYPYPFLDVDEHGYGEVLLTCVGITVLFVVLIVLARWYDRSRAPAPRDA